MELKPKDLCIVEAIFKEKDSFEGIMTSLLLEDTSVGLGLGSKQVDVYKDVDTGDYYAIAEDSTKAMKLTNRIKNENVFIFGLIRIVDLIYEYDEIIDNIEDSDTRDVLRRALTILHLKFSEKKIDRSVVKELEPVILYLYKHIDDYDDLEDNRGHSL